MKANFKLEHILSVVCNHYQLDKEKILSRSRKTDLVMARQMYCYFAATFTTQSYPKIADFINREHSTAMYSENKILVEKNIYKNIREDIQEIEARLFGTLIPVDVELLQMSVNYTKSFLNA